MFKSKIKSFWSTIAAGILLTGTLTNVHAHTPNFNIISNNTNQNISIGYQVCCQVNGQNTCSNFTLKTLNIGKEMQNDLPNASCYTEVLVAYTLSDKAIQSGWAPGKCNATKDMFVPISLDAQKNVLSCVKFAAKR